MRKKIKYAVSVLLIIGIVYAGYQFNRFVPLITGYGAKTLCSCVWIGNRNADDVIKNELNFAPVYIGSFQIHNEDSSATASVLGIGTKKAIYRKGIGCTLVGDDDRRIKVSNPRVRLMGSEQREIENLDWPMGDRTAAADTTNVDTAKLAEVVSQAFLEVESSTMRKIRSVIVVHNEKIVAEQYAMGYDKNSRQAGWSMSKSVINALLGILAAEGKLNVDETQLFKEWQNDERGKISIKHLMQSSSGLAWEENYSRPSDATNMLFRENNMGTFAMQAPLTSRPGEYFNYSSGSANILSFLIKQRTGENYHRFPYDSLFHKIGMLSAEMEVDASGNFVGSSYAFATARDWARFGLLYCNDGKWLGQQILPPGWIRFTSTPAAGAFYGEYGAMFWLNAGAPGNSNERMFPSVPTDMLWADGFEGQRIFVIPSLKLVVVKLALTKGNYLDEDKFLKDIISCIK